MKLTKAQREEIADFLRAGADLVLVKRPWSWFHDAWLEGKSPTGALFAAEALGTSPELVEVADGVCRRLSWRSCHEPGVSPMDEVAVALEAALLVEEGVLP